MEEKEFDDKPANVIEFEAYIDEIEELKEYIEHLEEYTKNKNLAYVINVKLREL